MKTSPNGQIDWLSADFNKNLDLPCIGYLNDRPIGQGKFYFYRIKEVTFEDEAPRKEALENVFASMIIPGVNLVYLILGKKNRVNFYFGIACDRLEPKLGIDIKEIAEDILKPSLLGNFRGSRIESLSDHELKSIQQYISGQEKKLNFCCMDGVPGIVKENENKNRNFQGVDRLVDIMLGDEFGFMVVIKPIQKPEELDFLEKCLDQCYSEIAEDAKKQIQNGDNHTTNHSSSSSFGSTESLAEGLSAGISNSIAFSLNESEQHGDSRQSKDSGAGSSSSISLQKSRSDTASTNDGQSYTSTTGISEQISEQDGYSQGKTESTSYEKIDKRRQQWLKYLDDVLYPRLDCAKGKGLFISSILLFSEKKTVLTKLSNVVKSIFNGDMGNRVPLHAVVVNDENRIFALQNFQQPLLTKCSTPELFNGFSIHSKCVHVSEKGYMFYAGCWMSSSELSKIAGLPQKEVVGLMLKNEVEFGLNLDPLEKPHKEPDPLLIGNLVQGGIEQEDIPVFLDKNDFDKHIFVAGVTGSGKTVSCQTLLLNSNRKFLVIEPAKTEYRSMSQHSAFKDDLLVYTLGNDKVAPFRLNPLEFSEGESISSRVDMLMASIAAAFDMEAAIPQIIEKAIYRCYEDFGWDVNTDTNQIFGNDAYSNGVYAFPTLGDVLSVMPEIIKQQGFDERLDAEYLGSIRARLQGLLVGAKGLMLNCRRSINFSELLDHNVVLELEEIRNGAEKSLLIGFILTNLMVAIKHKFEKDHNPVNHITLVEEAHRLMTRFEPGDNPNKKHAVEMFADMLAEVRKYGESMIIADQIPNKLTPDVIKNTNIKIVHRTFARDDKDVIGSSMALSDEQKDFLSSLPTGHAVVFSGTWQKAMHIKIKCSMQEKLVTDSFLRHRILLDFSQKYKEGIFPGLELLKKEPSVEDLENYMNFIQNRDVRQFFENTSFVDKRVASALTKMLEKCDDNVVAMALAVQYFSADVMTKDEVPRRLQALLRCINTRLNGDIPDCDDLRLINSLRYPITSSNKGEKK